jgi:hypothetical protein
VVGGQAPMHPHTVFPCRRPDLEDASDVTITSGTKPFAISKRSTLAVFSSLVVGHH